MATFDETLESNAARPARMRTLNGDVFQHTLSEQIAYAKFKASQAARTSGRGPLAGLRIARAIPGGTVAPSADGDGWTSWDDA